MEKIKHYELSLLIAIRNNRKVPIDEFYKLFDDNWHVFSSILNELETKGLFMPSALEHLPGLYKYELTKKGNLRITELLDERSIAIDLNLVQLRNKKELGKVTRLSIFRRIAGFFTHPGKVELTVPGKNNVIRTY